MRRERALAVLQASGVFLAGGWLIYEIIAELTIRLGLPDWVTGSSLVLLLLGLPVVAATAYVQHGPRAPVPVDPGAPGEATRGGTRGLGPAGARSTRLARVLTWRRALGGGVAVFALLGVGVVGFTVMRSAGIGPAGSLLAQGVLDANEPIVMADFTADRDPALAQAVAEALRVDLVQSNVIRLLPADELRETLRLMQREPEGGLPVEVAAEVVQRRGLRAFLRGDVRTLSGSYVLTTELVAGDGAVIAGFRETARDSTVLIDAVDRLSRQVRERVGESLKTIRATPSLAEVTTTSLAALRKYSEGAKISRETGDQLRMVELYTQAAALDSTFAAAWLGIGIALANLDTRSADRNAALRRAYALRERLPERERWMATAAHASFVERDPTAAVEAYRSLLALEPGHNSARNNLASRLADLRRYAESEAVLLEIPAERRTPINLTNLMRAQLAQAKEADAAATLAEMQARFPAYVTTPRAELELAAATGRYDGADSTTAQALAAPADNVTLRLQRLYMRALLTSTLGRVSEAMRVMDQVETITTRYGISELRGFARLATAEAVAQVLNDDAQAMRRVREWTATPEFAALPPHGRGYLQIARTYAAAGRPELAAAALADYERLVPEEDRRYEADDYIVSRGFVALHAGRAAEAIPLLRQAAESSACNVCALPHLARAYDAAAQPDSALAVYRRYLDTPSGERGIADAFWRGTVLLRLAELHDARGDSSEAARRYAEFVSLWNGADPELQPRVAAARRRLDALTATDR